MCVLAVQKRFWLSAEGVIIGVDVRNVPGPDGLRILNYLLLYEYRVDGVQYFGTDRIPVDVPYYLATDAFKELSSQFPPGDKIEIFYPESNPSISSARRDVVGLQKATMMVGLGVFMAIVFYFYIRVAFPWSEK